MVSYPPFPRKQVTARISPPSYLASKLTGSRVSMQVFPGCEVTLIFPRCLYTTMLWLMSSPSPVPCPVGLVVKNGSNILDWIS